MAHHGAHHNYTCTCTHTGSHTHNTLTAKPQIPDAAFLSCHEIITDVKLKPGNVEALPLPNSNNHLYHIMSAALHGVAAGITANELKRPKTRLIGNSKEHSTTSIYTATTTYEDGVLFMLQSTKDSSPLKGKLCIFDPASNNFTPGTPFLKLTSGTRNTALDIGMKFKIIKSGGSLSAPRPHQQAYNAIQDLVMAAYTAHTAGIEAPPLKPTQQQLVSYTGQLEDTMAHPFFQILDIGGTAALYKSHAASLKCKTDGPNAFILQPNSTIIADILSDNGGTITLRYIDENQGTTVMELILSQLPPSGPTATFQPSLTDILLKDANTLIILTPLVSNTSVTESQLSDALHAFISLGQSMMESSAGNRRHMLPPFSVRDSLTATVTISDIATQNINNLVFTLDQGYRGQPISAVPDAKRGGLGSYVFITADPTFAVLGMAGLSLLSSPSTTRHMQDALYMFSVSTAHSATCNMGMDRPHPIRPDQLIRRPGKAAAVATQGAMAALHTATDLWNGTRTPYPNNPAATMAAFKAAATEATNSVILNTPPHDLRPVAEEEAEDLDFMGIMFGADTISAPPASSAASGAPSTSGANPTSSGPPAGDPLSAAGATTGAPPGQQQQQLQQQQQQQQPTTSTGSKPRSPANHGSDTEVCPSPPLVMHPHINGIGPTHHHAHYCASEYIDTCPIHHLMGPQPPPPLDTLTTPPHTHTPPSCSWPCTAPLRVQPTNPKKKHAVNPGQDMDVDNTGAGKLVS